jgi:hypothetical protein
MISHLVCPGKTRMASFTDFRAVRERMPDVHRISGIRNNLELGPRKDEPAIESAVARLEAGFRWDEEFGAKPFFEGEVEPCINGGTLAVGAYFGRPTESLARRLVAEQPDDGGWNCEAP